MPHRVESCRVPGGSLPIAKDAGAFPGRSALAPVSTNSPRVAKVGLVSLLRPQLARFEIKSPMTANFDALLNGVSCEIMQLAEHGGENTATKPPLPGPDSFVFSSCGEESKEDATLNIAGLSASRLFSGEGQPRRVSEAWLLEAADVAFGRGSVHANKQKENREELLRLSAVFANVGEKPDLLLKTGGKRASGSDGTAASKPTPTESDNPAHALVPAGRNHDSFINQLVETYANLEPQVIHDTLNQDT